VIAERAGRRTIEEVYEAARSGDERSLSAIEEAAGHLGVGLANLVTVLGPDCIVIGGGISSAGELVLEPIRRAMRRRVTLAPVDRIRVVAAELGSIAGAVGAALASTQGAQPPS
jgi:glucokinase